MRSITELAAAGFFFAAGLLAAVTAPDWIIGVIVGLCLLLVGTILFQKGMNQLMQEMQAYRTEERAQAEKQLAAWQAMLESREKEFSQRMDTFEDEMKENTSATCERLTTRLQILTETAREIEQAANTEHMQTKAWYEAQTQQYEKQAKALLAKLDKLYETGKDKLDAVGDKIVGLHDDIETQYEEQAKQRAEQVKVLVGKLDADHAADQKNLGALYKEIAGLHDDVKQVCEDVQTAVENTMQDWSENGKDQREDIEKLCETLKTSAKDICDKVNSQQIELQTFLKAENEANRESMEQIMKNYSEVTAQDAQVLKALGEEVHHG